MSHVRMGWAGGLLFCVVAGCSLVEEGAPSDFALRAMPEPAEGAALYAQHCAACHGPAGQGGGAQAAGLNPSPPDLTQISVRNGGTFPRISVLSTLDGYTRVADGPAVMPEFGASLEGDLIPVDLEDGTQSPVPRALVALLVYLETLQE